MFLIDPRKKIIEKIDWNNGICQYTGKPWKLIQIYSSGLRKYQSFDCKGRSIINTIESNVDGLYYKTLLNRIYYAVKCWFKYKFKFFLPQLIKKIKKTK